MGAEGQPHLLRASKNRVMDGALALGGHHLVATHNNQLEVGGHSGSDVGEAAHLDQSVWGKLLFGGLRQPPFDKDTHNN